VLFLDEPTGGVDPVSRRRFWNLIDEMAAEGVTIIVTTHYMDEAEHCDRIALMHAGRLVALGTVGELKGVFAGRAVLEVACERPLEALDRLEGEEWVAEVSIFGTRLHVVSGSVARTGPDDRDRTPEETRKRLGQWLEREGFGPAVVEPVVPSLEDIFIYAIQSASAP
jgi:ABC-2 type transport system ATP-binding protein